jgi:hypothetical protein
VSTPPVTGPFESVMLSIAAPVPLAPDGFSGSCQVN